MLWNEVIMSHIDASCMICHYSAGPCDDDCSEMDDMEISASSPFLL